VNEMDRAKIRLGLNAILELKKLAYKPDLATTLNALKEAGFMEGEAKNFISVVKDVSNLIPRRT
jgi:hypothetical protein